VHTPGQLVRITPAVDRGTDADGKPLPPLPLGSLGQFCPMHEPAAVWLARHWPALGSVSARGAATASKSPSGPSSVQ
jgi:hypothetical protein